MTVDCQIEDVVITKLERFSDKRGWLTEIFRADTLPPDYTPAMCYFSLTKPGLTRGPHEHRRQTDLLYFSASSHFIVYLWDNRPESPSFGRHFRIEADCENQLTILIPPGVVHAYKNIGPVDGITGNAPDMLYRGAGKAEPIDEIRHEDNLDTPFVIED